MTHIDRYDYAFDPEGDAWAARVLRRIPPQGSVLELGPGPGAMTRVLLARGYAVTVVENDPEALSALQALGAQCIASDLDGSDWTAVLADQQFDVILACDVLEHLRRPDEVLRALNTVLAPTGSLIISVPNIAYAGVVAGLRQGVFDYSDKGQLDRTHVHFFTRRSLERNLLDCGWAPRIWEANRVPLEQSEFAGCWKDLSDAQRSSLRDGWHDFDVYQWMVVATASSNSVAWEGAAARAQVDQLREELQALSLQQKRELASLLEHQKAFSEAKEIIEELQGEVARLHKQTMLFETEVQRLGKLLFDRTLLGHLRRLMGHR
ncbi:MAG: methyltransferase domain-containing protein [Simplicispira suum]|uniref:class I SAM-dependent methyltransferase n=1 Tax=Simplicispira suum TaxID=2109915 RepID=UPI001C6BD800|nr:methyltransferase domain-containing protein [Simplicispira suum]MBW7831917.1 methyltransferase domain-containing protein [Simplicispira suum]